MSILISINSSSFSKVTISPNFLIYSSFNTLENFNFKQYNLNNMNACVFSNPELSILLEINIQFYVVSEVNL